MSALSRLLTVLVLALSGCAADPAYVPVGTRVGVDPAGFRGNYFSWVWPDDRRLDENGYIDTLEFPNPNHGGLFETVLSTSEGLVKGWGLSAPIFVPFTGAIDVTSLPGTPADSLSPEASVFLVSLASGERTPIDWKWMESETSFLPGNVLAVRPVPGVPLAESTKYALVVTTAVKDAKGEAIGPAESLWRVLVETREPEPAPADVAHWKPLLSWLDASKTPRDRVAGASVFTTQDATGELFRIRDALLEGEPPALESLDFSAQYSQFMLFEGSYSAPNFQHGTPPYTNSGGEFRFDDSGAPLVGATESLRLSVCVPKGEVPEGGFPVVIYSHGTGGDYLTIVEDSTCTLLAREGIAGVSIDQVLHGPRASGGTCFGMPVENCFFNIVNARSGRSTIRQSALDNVSLRRLVETLSITAEKDPEERTVVFNTEHIGFFGHSQGGLTGALYAALDPSLAGMALSAAGGHLSTSILMRDDGQLADLATGSLFLALPEGEVFDFYHPALALVQTLGEAADPLSWTPYWLKKPEGRRKHVFLTSGWEDDATPPESSEALAACAGVPQFSTGHRESLAHELWKLEPFDGPAHANVEASAELPAVTAGFQQFPGQGHFPIFYVASARVQLAAFLKELVAGKTPSIPSE